MKKPQSLARRGGSVSDRGSGNAGRPASSTLPVLGTAKKIERDLAARAELNQIPSGFFNPQPLGCPLGRNTQRTLLVSTMQVRQQCPDPQQQW